MRFLKVKVDQESTFPQNKLQFGKVTQLQFSLHQSPYSGLLSLPSGPHLWASHAFKEQAVPLIETQCKQGGNCPACPVRQP